MPDDLFPPHLQQLYTRRSQLQEMLARIQQERDFEDDPKRQVRFERDIADTNGQLRQLEQEICQQGLREARQLRLKQSYARAALILRHLLADGLVCPELPQELAGLEALVRQQGQTPALITGLSRIQDQKLKDIRPAVATALKKVEDNEAYADLVEQVRLLLDKDNDFGAEDFVFWWENLADRNADGSVAGNEKAGVAERIRAGNMVLFLGSGVVGDAVPEADLARQLAQQASYGTFAGSLSSIAEYYWLKPGLGTETLLKRMGSILSADAQTVALYQQLAALSTRLVLISAAYDDLLEQAFMATGKPFVSLTSIIQQGRHGIGHVLVSFSDNNPDAGVYPKEEVSGLKLADYSVIYKIRGTCRVRDGVEFRNTIALTESDYFSFARHAEKIIPDYLAGQLLNRPLLFIGYRPRHWEDRLLAVALLKKREFAGEPCYRLVTQGMEPMEEVFWDNNNVKRYEMDVRELERYLEGGMV